MATANINGVQYGWASFQFMLYGKKVTGIQSVNVKTDRGRKPVMGAGDRMIGYVNGSVSHEASIKVTLETFDAMVDIAPERDVTAQEPADIIVTYAKTATSPKKTLILRDAIPNGFSTSSEAGSEDEVSVELPLFVTDIQL